MRWASEGGIHGTAIDARETGDGHGADAYKERIDEGDVIAVGIAGPEDDGDDERDKSEDEEMDAVKVEVLGGSVSPSSEGVHERCWQLPMWDTAAAAVAETGEGEEQWAMGPGSLDGQNINRRLAAVCVLTRGPIERASPTAQNKGLRHRQLPDTMHYNKLWAEHSRTHMNTEGSRRGRKEG